MVQFTPHALERMTQRGITRDTVISALSNTSETIRTKSNRLALFSTINNRYLLIIIEKVNNEDMVITAMWSNEKRLRRIGFTKV
ncbi:MAG: DUF4258 domain-containing protein [Nitrososphaerales archaeon]